MSAGSEGLVSAGSPEDCSSAVEVLLGPRCCIVPAARGPEAVVPTVAHLTENACKSTPLVRESIDRVSTSLVALYKPCPQSQIDDARADHVEASALRHLLVDAIGARVRYQSARKSGIAIRCDNCAADESTTPDKNGHPNMSLAAPRLRNTVYVREETRTYTVPLNLGGAALRSLRS